MMEYDIHTILDGLTLLATGGVIFCMLLQSDIRGTYQKDQDKLQFYFVVGSTLKVNLRDGGGDVSLP